MVCALLNMNTLFIVLFEAAESGLDGPKQIDTL